MSSVMASIMTSRKRLNLRKRERFSLIRFAHGVEAERRPHPRPQLLPY